MATITLTIAQIRECVKKLAESGKVKLSPLPERIPRPPLTGRQPSGSSDSRSAAERRVAVPEPARPAGAEDAAEAANAPEEFPMRTLRMATSRPPERKKNESMRGVPETSLGEGRRKNRPLTDTRMRLSKKSTETGTQGPGAEAEALA